MQVIVLPSIDLRLDFLTFPLVRLINLVLIQTKIAEKTQFLLKLRFLKNVNVARTQVVLANISTAVPANERVHVTLSFFVCQTLTWKHGKGCFTGRVKPTSANCL